jgi:hypothetical protein
MKKDKQKKRELGRYERLKEVRKNRRKGENKGKEKNR